MLYSISHLSAPPPRLFSSRHVTAKVFPSFFRLPSPPAAGVRDAISGLTQAGTEAFVLDLRSNGGGCVSHFYPSGAPSAGLQMERALSLHCHLLHRVLVPG